MNYKHTGKQELGSIIKHLHKKDISSGDLAGRNRWGG